MLVSTDVIQYKTRRINILNLSLKKRNYMKKSSNKVTSAPELIAKILVIIFSLILFTVNQANAQVRYKLTTKIENFTAWTINEKGQVSGRDGDEKAVVYSPSNGVIKLPIPDGLLSSFGRVLNEIGQVAGELEYSSSYWGKTYKTFIYTPGISGGMKLLDTAYTFGWGGYTITEDGSPIEMISQLPTWTVPGSGFTTAITANGYAVGYSKFNPSNTYGMGWRLNLDGTFDKIGIEINAGESIAFGINESGVAVGRAIPNGSGFYAFANIPKIGNINLFDETDPSSRLGWTSFSSAQDITSDGRIVGWGVYSPNGWFNYLSSFILTPSKQEQTISQISLENNTIKVGGSTPITATASSGLIVTFTSNTSNICTVIDKIMTAVTKGVCTITASQVGNSDYNAATPVNRSVSIGKGAQTITFTTLTAIAVKGTSNISASTSSGLQLTFTSNTPNVCKIRGSTVMGVKAGICNVTARQAGNTNYNAAIPVTKSVTISKSTQTITFNTLPTVVLNKKATLSATASSGLIVKFTSNSSSICRVTGKIMTAVKKGVCTITASQVGNSDYNAATPVTNNYSIE
jgi:hypothetical protein